MFGHRNSALVKSGVMNFAHESREKRKLIEKDSKESLLNKDCSTFASCYCM